MIALQDRIDCPPPSNPVAGDWGGGDDDDEPSPAAAGAAVALVTLGAGFFLGVGAAAGWLLINYLFG